MSDVKAISHRFGDDYARRLQIFVVRNLWQFLCLFFPIAIPEFLMSFFKKLALNNRGATAVEYALIAALITVVAVGAFTTVGQKVNTKVTAVGTAFGS